MRTSRRDRLPLHHEISEMLAREIKAGILLDGEKLEPERIMAKRLGIAVGTLRKALADLNDKGLLERVQGSGNYVRNIDQINTIYGFFRLELLDGGGLPSASTLSVNQSSGTSQINFSEQNRYYRIRRLRFLNGRGVALEEIWLDASYTETSHTETSCTKTNYAHKAPTKSNLPDSLYQYYKDHLGFWIARVEDSLSISSVPQWKPENFCPESTSPWGFVERRSWDQRGKQAEYSKTWFDSNSSRYVARWK